MLKKLKATQILSLCLVLALALLACATNQGMATETRRETSASGLTDSKPLETTPTMRPENSTPEMSSIVASQADLPLVPESVTVPVRSLDLASAEPGIGNHRVKAFFTQLSEIPVYYHSTDQSRTDALDRIIYINPQAGYFKFKDQHGSRTIISEEGGSAFLLDNQEQTIQNLDKDQLAFKQLSPFSFSQILYQAQKLYFVGEGQELFAGEPADFEEFTEDNLSFIRYYFRDDKIRGYRIYRDDSLQEEIVIHELNNKNHDNLFRLPDSYKKSE